MKFAGGAERYSRLSLLWLGSIALAVTLLVSLLLYFLSREYFIWQAEKEVEDPSPR